MQHDNHGHRFQNLMLVLFLINVIIAVLWPVFVPQFGTADYLIGFGVGLAVLTFFEREYGRRAVWLAIFVLYVLWAIVLSNLSLAWIVLQPRPHLDPGIIAIPLTITSGLEITILASVITLTPGTLSVDLGVDPTGHDVLYVHNLRVGDPDEFRASIKEGFERRLLCVTRGSQA